MTSVQRRSTCRLCGSPDIELVIPLAPTPPADAYVTADLKDEPQPLFPLDVFYCKRCRHVQLVDVVDPAELFRNYLYLTSSSLGLVEHFRRYADEVASRVGPPMEGTLAVDIGSNEGTLLRFFRDRGMRVLGIDAAENIAALATRNGIETVPAFFSYELARRIRSEHGAARIVTANNVFAHSDALPDMVEGIRELLDRDGVFIFEAIYLVDMVEKFLFDTVYHEHLCFHSVRPLRALFARHGLELIDVERIPSKGGSIRGFVQQAGGPHDVAPAVGELVALEDALGFDRPETFQRYYNQIGEKKRAVLEFLTEAKRNGASIAGYGASATATTLVYHFELGELLDFIADDNPDRQGRFSPGHHIPILSSDALYERKPEYVVVLAWQYAVPILGRHVRFTEQGGRFVLPMPELRTV